MYLLSCIFHINSALFPNFQSPMRTKNNSKSTNTNTPKMRQRLQVLLLLLHICISQLIFTIACTQATADGSTAASGTEETCSNALDDTNHSQNPTSPQTLKSSSSSWSVPNPYKFFEETQLKTDNNGNFGHFLDAGTGSTSLRWISTILHRSEDTKLNAHDYEKKGNVSMESYTAITADEEMHQRITEMVQNLDISEQGQVIVGNWMDGVRKDGSLDTRGNNYLFHGGKTQVQFDTILADYLIGAMDRFSPYFQDVIFERLAVHLKPGGRLFVLGLEPTARIHDILSQIKHVKDACMLLAGERPYREYPLEWIQRNLAKVEGLSIVEMKIYPLSFSFEKLVDQINVGRIHLKDIASQDVAESMATVLNDLQSKALEITKKSKTGKVRAGFEYALVIEKM